MLEASALQITFSSQADPNQVVIQLNKTMEKKTVSKSFDINESTLDIFNFLSKTFGMNDNETINFIIDYIGQNWERTFKELNITKKKKTKQPINEIIQAMIEKAVKQILDDRINGTQ